jgi:hypothetical protein
LALEAGGWSTPRPGHYTPGKTRYPLYRRPGGGQVKGCKQKFHRDINKSIMKEKQKKKTVSEMKKERKEKGKLSNKQKKRQ